MNNKGDEEGSCSDPYGLFSPDSVADDEPIVKDTWYVDNDTMYDASCSSTEDSLSSIKEDSLQSESTSICTSAANAENLDIINNLFAENPKESVWKFENIPKHGKREDSNSDSNTYSDSSSDNSNSILHSLKTDPVSLETPSLLENSSTSSEELKENSIYSGTKFRNNRKQKLESPNLKRKLDSPPSSKKRSIEDDTSTYDACKVSPSTKKRKIMRQSLPGYRNLQTENIYEGDISESSTHLCHSQNSFTGIKSNLEEKWKINSPNANTASTCSTGILDIHKESCEVVKINEKDLKKLNKIHLDKIGCYNVQNRYNHITAMELFLREGFSFLSLQEPRGSQYKTSKSWISKTVMDLGKARIKCFDSKFQIILVDNVAWGGKEEEDMKEHLSGRIISVSYTFGCDDEGRIQRLGIISIYGVSGEGKSKSGVSKKSVRSLLTSCVVKIKKDWLDKYPGICIMILGDLQETISTENIDNFGKFRRET